MDKDLNRDIASPSHQRPPFSDPLAGGADPTSPGAPHEPGGSWWGRTAGALAGAVRAVVAGFLG